MLFLEARLGVAPFYHCTPCCPNKEIILEIKVKRKVEIVRFSSLLLNSTLFRSALRAFLLKQKKQEKQRHPFVGLISSL